MLFYHDGPLPELPGRPLDESTELFPGAYMLCKAEEPWIFVEVISIQPARILPAGRGPVDIRSHNSAQPIDTDGGNRSAPLIASISNVGSGERRE